MLEAKRRLMLALVNLYQQLESMEDSETKKIVETYIEEKERELKRLL